MPPWRAIIHTVAVLVLAFLIFTAFPLAGPGAPTEVHAQSTDDIAARRNAPVREEPSGLGSRLYTAQRGTTLDIAGVTPDGDWYLLSDGGWIHERHLDRQPTRIAQIIGVTHGDSITLQLYDEGGTLLSVDTGLASLQEIGPGKSSPFQVLSQVEYGELAGYAVHVEP